MIAHRGNFDFMRFVAAMMVWYSHSRYLYGYYDDFMPFLGVYAVFIFFVISGYLITASYMNSGCLVSFIRNRALRILPAMAAITLLTVFVMGPLVTHLTVQEYFFSRETWIFLRSLLVLPKFYLPGVFDDHVNPSVNASVWTLSYEVLCYILIACLGVIGWLRPRVMAAVFAGCWGLRLYEKLAYLDLAPTTALSHLPPLYMHACDLICFFSAGAFLYTVRRKIPLTFTIVLPDED